MDVEGYPTMVLRCAKCAKHYFDNPMLIGAFASVGIEHGKSTWEMAESYFAEHHKEHGPKRKQRATRRGK